MTRLREINQPEELDYKYFDMLCDSELRFVKINIHHYLFLHPKVTLTINIIGLKTLDDDNIVC